MKGERFVIERIDPDSGIMQGVTLDGKKREFQWALTRIPGDFRLDIVPYYTTDPESKPRWEDSEPWTVAELQGMLRG